MEDLQIVNLFWERYEEALRAASEKYGRYCHSVAYNVLSDEMDAQECVNDCLLRTWNSIPPARPESLKAYMGKITRNLALDMAERALAKKRGGGELVLALDELAECIPDRADEELSAAQLAEAISSFLRTQDEKHRKVFVRRYWYGDSLARIAELYSMNEKTVATYLFRTREKLRVYLRKEGFDHE
jgi:RNA polymerase sigma-70 factor (ECF subfamily)